MLRPRSRDDELGCSRLLQLFLLACCLPGGLGAITKGVLTLPDFASATYACDIADFGRGLEPYREHRSIVMRPPEDPQLCEFPSEIFGTAMDSNETWVPVEFPSNVALLVSLGGCDIYQKIMIAAQLFERVSSSVRYIVFYNNDGDYYDRPVPILPMEDGSGVDFPESAQKLSFLSVSTSSGGYILDMMDKVAISGRNPIFLAEGNEEWDLYMVVEVLDASDDAPATRNPVEENTTRVNAGNFYWFRLILFALLIMSPCCRGAYLWYNGGGRIHFRRNENGRIVGLLYISPVSYWFASNGVQDTTTPVTDRLTEDQVLALPEIIYKCNQETDTLGKESTEDTKDDVTNLDDEEMVVGSGSADENEDETDETTVDRVTLVSENVGLDEAHISECNLTTSCTTCSICIDEFEPGEKIRLLPRCKHAFHTECIMPWLTERQGCCPLCKTSVLEECDDDEPGNDLANSELEPTLSHDDTGTEQDSLGAGVMLTNEDQRQTQHPEDIAGLESESVIRLSMINTDSRIRPGNDEGNVGVAAAEVSREEERRINFVPTEGILSSASLGDGEASSTGGGYRSRHKD